MNVHPLARPVIDTVLHGATSIVEVALRLGGSSPAYKVVANHVVEILRGLEIIHPAKIGFTDSYIRILEAGELRLKDYTIRSERLTGVLTVLALVRGQEISRPEIDKLTGHVSDSALRLMRKAGWISNHRSGRGCVYTIHHEAISDDLTDVDVAPWSSKLRKRWNSTDKLQDWHVQKVIQMAETSSYRADEPLDLSEVARVLGCSYKFAERLIQVLVRLQIIQLCGPVWMVNEDTLGAYDAIHKELARIMSNRSSLTGADG